MIENCYNCKNCIQMRNKNYKCLFKACNMGKIPYYPKEIPKDAKYNIGIEVCRFELKEKDGSELNGKKKKI